MPKARTSAMLPITSTSSPSTDAAFDAKLWCRAEPRLASRYRIERKDRGRQHQAARHQRIDGHDHHDRAEHRDARRQDVPRHHVLGGVDRVRRRGDPAREHPRLFLGEVGRRVAAQVLEQVAPQVARHGDERMRADPAAHAPEHVVGGDQSDQDHERAPKGARMSAALAEHVDQVLDRVLRGEGASDGGEHADENGGVGDRVTADVTKQERERAMRVAR